MRGRLKLLLALVILSLVQASAVSAAAIWSAHESAGGQSALLSQLHTLHDETDCDAQAKSGQHEEDACHDHLSGTSSMPFAIIDEPPSPPAPGETELMPVESAGYSVSGWILQPLPEPPRLV